MIQHASWSLIETALSQSNLIIGLAGPPGVGKTASCFKMGERLKKPVIQKVQSQTDLAPAEVLGMYVPEKNGFRWEPGPIDLCYSKGGMLIIDEISEASGPVKTFLYGALDYGPGGTISYVGRTFKQQPGYQVVATMNGYPDQGMLPEPLLDRFDAWFLVTEPSEDLYRLLDQDLREICRSSYEGAQDKMAGPVITFRMLLAVQKLRRLPNYTLEDVASAACYGNRELAQGLLEVLVMSDDVDTDEPEDEGSDLPPGTFPEDEEGDYEDEEE